MPLGRKPKTVPKFSAYQIRLAELCARALWEGIDFRTNEPTEVSEELLLNNFYIAFQRLLKQPNSLSLISETRLRQLIRVAELKAMYRSTIPINFKLGIAGITRCILPIHIACTSKKPTISKLNAGMKAVMDLSVCWVKNPNLSLNGNYRVPFSSRILFLCTPELSVFNFSNALAKSMQLQTRPQAALTAFNIIMADGLIRNALLLSPLKLPTRSVLTRGNWVKIKNTDWWQRRVLDMAMLIHHRIFVPHRTYVAAARPQLFRSKKKP